MGIRIHKHLGYGVEAFDASAEDLDNIHERAFENTNDFTQWWKDTYPEASTFKDDMIGCGHQLRAKKEKRLDCMGRSGYADEMDHDAPIVFSPPGWNDWSRYDDLIDYVEAGMEEDGNLDSVKLVNGPIYPFVNYVRYGDEYPRGYEKYDLYAYEKEEGKNYTPYVPYSIKLFLEYAGFSDPHKLWTSLRPMIYTYWS